MILNTEPSTFSFSTKEKKRGFRSKQKESKKQQHLKHITGVRKLVAKNPNITPSNFQFSQLGFGMDMAGEC